MASKPTSAVRMLGRVLDPGRPTIRKNPPGLSFQNRLHAPRNLRVCRFHRQRRCQPSLEAFRGGRQRLGHVASMTPFCPRR